MRFETKADEPSAAESGAGVLGRLALSRPEAYGGLLLLLVGVLVVFVRWLV